MMIALNKDFIMVDTWMSMETYDTLLIIVGLALFFAIATALGLNENIKDKKKYNEDSEKDD